VSAVAAPAGGGAVSALRRVRKAAFSIDDAPFQAYRVVDGWRAKLFAIPELGGAGH
jgi:hypothetical protein